MSCGTTTTGRKFAAKFFFGSCIRAKGTAVGAQTGSSALAVGETDIALASAGSGTILAGDVIKFDMVGHPDEYRLTTGDAAVGGGGTLVLEDPLGLRVAVPAGTPIIVVRNEPTASDWQAILALRSKNYERKRDVASGNTDASVYKSTKGTTTGFTVSFEGEIDTTEEHGYPELMRGIAFGESECWLDITNPETGEGFCGFFVLTGKKTAMPTNDLATFTFDGEADGYVRETIPVAT